jgi:hypothetical protein
VSLYPPLFLSPTPFLAYLNYSSDGQHKDRNANAENNDAENNNTANPRPTLEQGLMM